MAPSRIRRLAWLSASIVCVALAAAAAADAAARPSAAAAFDSNRAWGYLRQLVAFGPRPAGSRAIEQTRTYIRQQLAAVGLTAVDQAWSESTPIGTVRFVNLIATIPGARKERLVLAGHYDTKLSRNFPFVGADDGGSSAAFLLEIAHALKARRNPLTIELLFLDGEEAFNWDWAGTDNTYGSRHYVEAAKRDGSIASLKALILVDMIADRNLRIRRETKSTPWLTDAIWGAAHRLRFDSSFLPTSAEIEDDHEPFLKAGVPSVDIIDLEYEAWHSAQDDLDHVSARSLQVVGDVVLAALPSIEARLTRTR